MNNKPVRSCPICPNCGEKRFVRLASDNNSIQHKRELKHNSTKGISDEILNSTNNNDINYNIKKDLMDKSSSSSLPPHVQSQTSQDSMIILQCRNCNTISKIT